MTAPARITTLVTGASSGIGEAFARALAAQGHDLILTARRADRLEALAAELQAKLSINAATIPADLAEPGAVEKLTAAIDEQGLRVDWLINNAGYGVSGAFDGRTWAEHSAFLRVMVEAPTELIHRLLPAMRTRDYGRIINVASLAAHVPTPAGNTLYAGAKAYLVRVSQALAAENAGKDIRVLALSPGFTLSEFHDVTGTRALMDKMPKGLWQTSEEVVAEGLAAIEGPDAVRVTGRTNRRIVRLLELLPDRIGVAFMRRQGKRYRNSAR